MFQVEGPQRGTGVKKIFQKMLILVFEVIMEPSKYTFEIGIFFHVLAVLLQPSARQQQIYVGRAIKMANVCSITKNPKH